MKSALEILEHDHRFINKVVATMDFFADALDEGRPVDMEMLRDLVQFMRIFAEQCHHGKEEQYLFPVLKRKPALHAADMLSTLEVEHRKVHTLTDELAQAVSAYVLNRTAGRKPLADVFRQIVAFYPRHIWHEEYLLFPIAKQVLSAAEQETIARGFSEIELEIGADVHRAFEALARFIEEAVSRSEMSEHFVTN